MSEKINVSTNYKFYILNDRNYGSWKWQFLNVMRALKYIPQLLDDDESKRDSAKDAEALALLGSTLDDRGARTIQNYSNFRDAFNAIVQMNENKTADEKQSLFERLNCFRIDEVAKVKEGIGEIMEIVAQLKSMNEPISTTNIIGVMSAALPSEFELFKAAWKGTPEERRTVEEFRSRVFAESSELIAKKTSNAALMVRSGRKGRSTEGDICRYCKERGHWIRDCKKLKQPYDPNFRKNKKSESSITDANGIAFSAKTGRVQCMRHEWVADSGCTHHMSPYEELFESLSDCSDSIILADSGTALQVTGLGSIPTKSGTLKDVYLVPSLGQNLFSIRAASQNGLTYNGTDRQISFMRNKREILRATLRDNLYIIELYPLQNSKSALAATAGIWHKRFAHISKETIEAMSRNKTVNDLDIVKVMVEKCESCALGKCENVSHPARTTAKAQAPGLVLHVDTSGFIEASLGGSHYIVLCKDEYSSFRQVAFVAAKSSVADEVKKFINAAEVETGNKCLKLVSDNGTEYVNSNLNKFLTERGIVHERSAPHVSQQNGYIERDFRTVVNAARTMLAESKLDKHLWAEATSCAIYALNRATKHQKTPYELWHNRRPSVKNLHVFGELAVIKLKNHTTKFSEKGERARFIGYTRNFNTFKFLCHGKIKVSCDCVFLNKLTDSGHEQAGQSLHQSEPEPRSSEQVFAIPVNASRGDDIIEISNEQASSTISDLSIQSFRSIDDEQADADQSNGRASLDHALEQDESSILIVQQPEVRTDSLGRPMPQRDPQGRFISNSNGRQGRQRANLVALDSKASELPQNFEQARQRADWPEWHAAMQDEMNSLIKNQVFQEVPVEQVESKLIESRWVLTKKYNTDGTVNKYKARVVAKGYNQVYGIDFNETYCPVVHTVTLRMILAYAVQRSLFIRQFDVKTAFLYGSLDETIFMKPPDGYDTGKKVWLLQRSLYGLRQAPRMWNKTFDMFLKSLDLQASVNDNCIYYRVAPIVIIIIYVDDGLVCAEREEDAQAIMQQLESRFEIRELQLSQYRGIQIKRVNEGMIIHQSGYVQKILENFGFSCSKAVDTPVSSVKGLQGDSSRFADEELYRKAVGCLVYVAEASRPDIMHAVNRVSRKLSAPTEDDWVNVKRIYRYLRGKPALGILYSKSSGLLTAYTDADFAGDEQTRRSTTGFVILYGNSPIHWKSQRQRHVTVSSTESEYVALCTSAKEIKWLRKVGLELSMFDNAPTLLRCDNQSALKIAQSERITQRTRHLGAQDAYVRELIENQELKIEYVHARYQIADFLTKPVTLEKFSAARAALLLDLESPCKPMAQEGMLDSAP